ncbi:hypothetical protein HKX48_008269, partial [Thoreauomyces humboldtii]
QTTLANDRITNDNANVAANPEHWHPEHIPGPKEDVHKNDPSYVAYEKAGIESNEASMEEDEETDAIARAINSVVPHEDDPNTPVTTFRAVFLGTVFGAALCFANVLMSFRSSSVIIPATIITLISYPCGRFMAAVLPTHQFKTGSYVWSLNPGPFNMKEHVIVTLIASAAGGGIPYGLDNLIAQKWKGGQEIAWFEGFSWLVTTQMIGFGFAGILRRFVIWPREMVWPGNFSQLSIFATYWQRDDDVLADNNSTWSISRYKFFWAVAAIMFVWELLPIYIMPIFQAFSIMCFFSSNLQYKNNVSATEGLGFLSLTLDWEFITSTWMTTPFWVACVMLAGQVFWVWILVPLMQFTGSYPGGQKHFGNGNTGTGTYDVNSSAIYDKDGNYASKTKLYNAGTFETNMTYVADLAPFTLTPYFYTSYMMSFFNLSAVLVHIYLWYGRQLARQTRAMFAGEGRQGNDLHNRLMRAYPEVPEWFYAGILAVFLVLTIVVGEKTMFVMPWWSVLLATLITAVFIAPIGIIQSITGQQIGLNVVTEFVIGLILPGKVVTVMCFKSFGYNIMIQAMSLLSDLKLGHYLHIPPWHMLASQLYGTLIQCLLSVSISYWILDSWADRLGKGAWQANGYGIFFNAGGIWGAIGPKAFFTGQSSLIYLGFLAGFIAPIIPWAANKYYPSRWWIYINFPIMSAAYGTWGAGNWSNTFWMTLFVSWLFQFYIFRNSYAWWAKYNYVAGAGMDIGMAVCLIVFAFVSADHPFPVWAGNPDTNNGINLEYYCQGQQYNFDPYAATE